ncbi:hypothetical protein ACIP98_36505, partial [Streptomyces sp. NPDC088354]|uniref:hypothetical protein n=1 Tax=Streptomyces sp. NPDC088354 TaxID=3365856 RepID=UPI0038131D20
QIGYIGLTAFVLNVVVTVVLTLVLRAVKAPEDLDETAVKDYTADAVQRDLPEDQPDLPVATGH